QETLKVRPHRRRRKENQSVVCNRQAPPNRRAIDLPAESEGVIAVAPAQRVQPYETIAQRRLQLLRKRSECKASELQSVNIGIAIGRRQIDSYRRVGHRWYVVQFVADDVDAESELVHQIIRE